MAEKRFFFAKIGDFMSLSDPWQIIPFSTTSEQGQINGLVYLEIWRHQKFKSVRVLPLRSAKKRKIKYFKNWDYNFFVFMFSYTVHPPEQESAKSGDGYFWQILILVRARCEYRFSIKKSSARIIASKDYFWVSRCVWPFRTPICPL